MQILDLPAAVICARLSRPAYTGGRKDYERLNTKAKQMALAVDTMRKELDQIDQSVPTKVGKTVIREKLIAGKK